MVLYTYEHYNNNSFSEVNRDFVSTEMYLKNKEKYHYDSFIFGSSRTVAYKTNSWKRHLPQGSSPYIFSGNSETLFGIWSKIKYLGERGDTIKNALVMFCNDQTFSVNNDEGHLFRKDYRVSGESWAHFQFSFLKAYFAKGYFLEYIIKRFFHFVPYVKSKVESTKITYDNISNDLFFTSLDNKIQADEEKYYVEMKSRFYRRTEEEKERVTCINDNIQLKMLNDIREVFMKFNTSYYIINNPMYNQEKINKKDLSVLQNIFGENRVFDFSGKNKFTEEYKNYYEASHFRPSVGDSVMNIVYQTSPCSKIAN